MGYITKANPIGVDIVINDIISEMYDGLTSAGWTNYEAYHRCYKNPTSNEGQFIPEAYTSKYDGNNEYQEVLLNDKHYSTSFFITGDETTYDNGNYKVPISIIFQLNSLKLYPDLGHRADEEARNDAITTLRDGPNGGLITSIVTSVPKVYAEFDTDNINFSDMSPFHVFRVNLEVLVDYSCDYKCTYPSSNTGFSYIFNSGF